MAKLRNIQVIRSRLSKVSNICLCVYVKPTRCIVYLYNCCGAGRDVRLLYEDDDDLGYSRVALGLRSGIDRRRVRAHRHVDNGAVVDGGVVFYLWRGRRGTAGRKTACTWRGSTHIARW